MLRVKHLYLSTLLFTRRKYIVSLMVSVVKSGNNPQDIDSKNSLLCMMTPSNGTFSALLALCEDNLRGTDVFPSQRPVMWSFEVFFDLCLKNRLSKQSKYRWFEMLSSSLWRQYNGPEAWNECDVSTFQPQILITPWSHYMYVLVVLKMPGYWRNEPVIDRFTRRMQLNRPRSKVG